METSLSLEKSGRLLLSQEEFDQYLLGQIPERLLERLDLTMDELKSIIVSGSYEIVDLGSKEVIG